MNTDSLIEEIKKHLTGDPQKDGPFLKEQSEKYRNEENADEINRELAKIMYECTYEDIHRSNMEYLSKKNPVVNEKLRRVRKRYENLNFGGGIEILREIIKDNIFAWIDNEQYTYKSFGTPIEHALYLQMYQPEKEIRSVSCNLSEVYSLYGWGLTQKNKYTEAIDAFQRALELNPADPEIYIKYCELLKKIKQADELRHNTDKLMQCAVTKIQLGTGYFNYSFYFTEKGDFDKAIAMLEMSRIFLGDTAIIRNEMKFISDALGLGSNPAPHSREQLIHILNTEKIQPGPSAVVVNSAYEMAKHAEQNLDYELAKYFYEVVWELTENDDIRDEICELERTIGDLKE